MNQREAKFVKTVIDFYTVNGRHVLPWRKTSDPYLILVSEIMLQQTQVERVVPKYQAFISAYPTAVALAQAPLRDVLVLWQGLGYNRRAKSLHEATRHIRTHYAGEFPHSREAIMCLPGVGPYTAGAILAFAFNEAVPMIETNIRTVYLHHFFRSKTDVPDTELRSFILKTLDTKSPRTWYYALMDYGSYLKKTLPNPSKRSKHHTVQSKFVGSSRQIRGAIIRHLGESLVPKTSQAIAKELSHFEARRIAEQLAVLVAENLVTKKSKHYQLPT